MDLRLLEPHASALTVEHLGALGFSGEGGLCPNGEQAWARRYGSNFWVFPNWRIDLTGKQELLKKLGYRCLVRLDEPLPAGVKLKKRPGLWNWDIGLK